MERKARERLGGERRRGGRGEVWWVGDGKTIADKKA